MRPEPLLTARGLAVDTGGRRLLDALDLDLYPGQCWCLLGRNGSGKTSLLHTLAGLQTAGKGDIHLRGQTLTGLRRRQIATRLGLLLQEPTGGFPASVLETVLQGRHPYLRGWQRESAADLAIAREALATLEIENLANRELDRLSGGERRRVAIATLLAQRVPLMLMDEPVAHLDLNHAVQLMHHLLGLCRKEGRCVLMVLHDINLAARFCDHAILLDGRGDALAGPAAEILRTEHLERALACPLQPLQTPHGPAWLPA